MKTTLHVEAPSDLSVGTIRIAGEAEEMSDWISTPSNRSFSAEDVKPGIYSAEIAPAGVAPRSVIFEVRDGEANEVQLPPFSSLVSSGSNVNFFDAASRQTVFGVPDSLNLDLLNHPVFPNGVDFPSLEVQRVVDLDRSTPVRLSSEKRRIAIGLSEEDRGRDNFHRFQGQARMEVYSGRIEIAILDNTERAVTTGHRVRLTTAIEGERIERCLLPLYRGGTRILVSAPPFAPADLELSITPVDTSLRAIFRALDAGTYDEVTAVRDDVVQRLGDDVDPWTSILTGLLAIRYPAVFPPIDPRWAESLVQRAGWAFDAHVIRASQVLSTAQTGLLDEQDDAVTTAIALLAGAQKSGSPYYRYTNQLFIEMASGIKSYLKEAERSVDPPVIERFNRLYNRWQRELPLQRGAGPTFTWLARDLHLLKERRTLVPYRRPSGKLTWSNTTVVFEGTIAAGQITILPGRSIAPEASSTAGLVASSLFERRDEEVRSGLSDFPAFARPTGPISDPNKGRFGGQTERDGFSLSANFEDSENPDWVTVILSLQASRSASIGLGDYAWFALHPTFSPQTFKVSFRGRRAQLRLRIWGGFTVGVWIPKANIELECDLSQLKDAPDIVRSR
jgi:hypothetical protein